MDLAFLDGLEPSRWSLPVRDSETGGAWPPERFQPGPVARERYSFSIAVLVDVLARLSGNMRPVLTAASLTEDALDGEGVVPLLAEGVTGPSLFRGARTQNRLIAAKPSHCLLLRIVVLRYHRRWDIHPAGSPVRHRCGK